jgi:inhibitor of cysteine peptidase
MESFPVQLSLQVSGYQPDGCDFPVIVEQTQNGSTINVRIYREIPANVRCAMNIVPYEAAINLGSFPAGKYTVNVNGTIIEVQV